MATRSSSRDKAARRPPHVPQQPNRRLWIGVLLLVLWTATVQLAFSGRIFFTGDEPHYLLATHSFLQDGDFDLLNNYLAQDNYRFGYNHPLSPQWVPLDGKPIDAEHGTAFPLLIAPFYAAEGTNGVRVFLIVLGGCSVLLAAASASKLAGRPIAAWIAGGLIALAPAWQMQSSRVYPDMPAGLCACTVIFILARHARRGGATAGFPAGFIVGFCVCFPPVLYVKYGLLTAVLGLTALWINAFRRNLAVYVGGATAIVLGAVNIALYAEQGAVGGNFASGHSYLFTIHNAFGRYWTQWFDAHHGLFVYEPYTILALWAAITYLRPAATDREKVLTGLSAAVIVYTLMHAFWNAGPAYSVPARYLTVLIPAACVLVTCWVLQHDSLERIRQAAVAAGAAIAMAVYATSALHDVSLDSGLDFYTRLFPMYWMSWKTGPAFPAASHYGLWGYLAVLTILATKVAGSWKRRQDERGSSPPVD